MSNISQFLPQIGSDLIVRVVRIAVETVCYGIYIILISFSTHILCRKRLSKAGMFLLLVTLVMFAGSSLFLALDIADVVERLKILLVNNPDLSFQEKQRQVDVKVERLEWTGEMLFIFMLILGDSVVIWRTWAVYWNNRKALILPLLTWTGSVVAGFYELGCDVRTGWSLANSDLSAASVGAKSCTIADTTSFSLSFATNFLCTALIAFKAWQHRRSMLHALESVQRTTQAQGILTLFVESGMVYLVLYIFQAIPIYGGKFNASSFIAVEAVNAIIQQAMGIYPTAIVVLVQMQKSLWDAPEVAQEISCMHFASTVGESTGGTRTGKMVESGTTNASENTARKTVVDSFVDCLDKA